MSTSPALVHGNANGSLQDSANVEACHFVFEIDVFSTGYKEVSSKKVSLMLEIAENIDIMIMNSFVSLIEPPCFDHHCADSQSL